MSQRYEGKSELDIVEISHDTSSSCRHNLRNYPIFTVRWLAFRTLGIPTVFFLGALARCSSSAVIRTMERNPNPNNLPVELNRTSLYLGLLFVFVTGVLVSAISSTDYSMSGKKSPIPTVEFPIAILTNTGCAWRSRWTEGVLPLWLVATAGGMAVLFVVGSSSRLLHRRWFCLNTNFQHNYYIAGF